MQTRQSDLNTALILCHVCVYRGTRENWHCDGCTLLENDRNTVFRKELSTRYSVDNIGDRGDSAPPKDVSVDTQDHSDDGTKKHIFLT
jgi:hypothetical protein